LKKILFIAPGNSIHAKRWVEFFNKRYEVTWISFHKFNDHLEINKNNLIYLEYTKFNFFKCVFQLFKSVKKINPSVIHIHSVSKYLILSTLLILNNNYNFKIIATPWGSDIKLSFFLIKKVIYYLLGKIHLVTTDSFKLLDDLKKNNINVIKINFGIDTNLFKQSNTLNNYVFVNPRGFDDVYRPYTLLKSINLIKNKITNLKFILLGDGHEKNKILQFINDNSLNNFIHISNKLDSNKYIDLIQSSAGMISCSISDAGISSSIAEFMSCNKIIIATSNSDNPYWIKDKQNGFLFNNDDYHSLANILLNIDKNINNINFKNRSLIIKENDISNEMKKMDNVYIDFK